MGDVQERKSSNEWIFTREMLENTPSIQYGYSMIAERQQRSKSVWFIKDLAKELRCEVLVLSTASVLFHRFFVFQSFTQHNRFIISAACLFLASKVEEYYRPARDVCSAYRVVRSRSEHFDAETECSGLLEKLLLAERVLLQSLGFDLQISHPYSTVIQKSKALKAFIQMEESRRALYQAAINFVNDSYRTCLCLQYEPRQIAVAAYFLAALHLGLKPVTQVTNSQKSNTEVTWLDLLESDIEEPTLKDICNQILQVYSDPPASLANLSELQIKLNGPDYLLESTPSHQSAAYSTSSNFDSNEEFTASTENKVDDIDNSRLHLPAKSITPYKPVEAYKPLPPHFLQPSPYHPLPHVSPQSASSPQSSHWSQHSSPPAPPQSDSPGYYIHPSSSRYTPDSSIDYVPPPPETPGGVSVSCPTGDYIPPPPPPPDDSPRSEILSPSKYRQRDEGQSWNVSESKRPRLDTVLLS